MKPIISILNLKNGVGTSALAWNIAHILELDIYQHDKAMHHIFRDKRIKSGKVQSKSVSVDSIDKRKFKSGVYDLGADINYGYVRQILAKSTVIVIPVELGMEVLIKTLATIKYVSQCCPECDIFVVINKLDNSDPRREFKYSYEIENTIEDLKETITNHISFFYVRYSYVMFRYLFDGFCLLDNFLLENAPKTNISNFELLQHLRYYTLDNMGESNRRKEKAKRELESADFFKKHVSCYENFKCDADLLFNHGFIEKNTKIIKDMLILATHIQRKVAFARDENNV